MADKDELDEELESNLILQKEELEALGAIYGEDFVLEQNYDDGDYDVYSLDKEKPFPRRFPVMPTFSITIHPDPQNERGDTLAPRSGDLDYLEARLIISFQAGYPTSSPPIYQLSIPWIRGGQKQVIAAALEELYLEHLGESIVYIWVEKLREMLRDQLNARGIADGANVDQKPSSSGSLDEHEHERNAVASSPLLLKEELIDRFSGSLTFNPEAVSFDGKVRNEACPSPNTSCHIEIQTGPPLTDRKSTFQAHVAPVSQIGDIRMVLDKLLQNKKIASATHNMYAYRILKGDSKIWLQDCDDDGETHAGSRLLHLLQILECKNVLVVVSRWYGGIQLHGDRFKHINNVARQALLQFGFIPSTSNLDEKKGEDNNIKMKKGSGKR